VRHFPDPCLTTPAFSAASSSAVHFCLGAPMEGKPGPFLWQFNVCLYARGNLGISVLPFSTCASMHKKTLLLIVDQQTTSKWKEKSVKYDYFVFIITGKT
jgi:hypothetical protein